MSLRNAWRAVAAVPLIIVMVLGCVQLVGSLAPTKAPSSASADFVERVGSVADTRRVTAADKPARKKAKKAAEKPSPSATPTTTSPSSPTSPQTSDPTLPPATSQPDPTRTPSPSPSAPGTPSDNPTPEEARDMCEEAGVNPLDLAAMAACIASKMGG